MSYHSQGLSRALAALRALGTAEQPLSLATLSRTLDLPKSTLIRLLIVMEEQGFVRRMGDPPTYTIGHSIHEIAEAYRPADVAEISSPFMAKLAAELGFTTNLGVLEGRSVLHLNVEEPQRALRFAASGTLDFSYCTGLGKMLLSTLDPALVSDHVPETDPYTSFTTKTITTRAELDAELERVRSNGVSIDDEERNRGVTCMAVLLPTEGSFPISLSISAPSGELTPNDQLTVLPTLRRTAAEMAAAPRFASALTALKNRIAS